MAKHQKKGNAPAAADSGESTTAAKLVSGASAPAAPAPAPAPDLETAAETAAAQGVGEPPAVLTVPGVLATIGPDDAAPTQPATLPTVDPLTAAETRRKRSREDAVHELRVLAKRSAEGEALTDADNDRIVELCELAKWTTGMFKAEVVIAGNRLKTRKSVEDLPRARRTLEEARAQHQNARAELERATRELQQKVDLWATRIAEAEAFIVTAEDAEKQLLRSAPEPIRLALRRARAASDNTVAAMREAEERLNHALRTLNEHKGARGNVGDGTEEGARLDGLIAGAAEAVREAQENLDTVRERKAEIDSEVTELHELSLTA